MMALHSAKSDYFYLFEIVGRDSESSIYTSETDVCSPQILKSTDDSHTERINIFSGPPFRQYLLTVSTLSPLTPLVMFRQPGNLSLFWGGGIFCGGRFFIRLLTVTTLKYFCINHGDQMFILFWNHHTCSSQLFLLQFVILLQRENLLWREIYYPPLFQSRQKRVGFIWIPMLRFSQGFKDKDKQQ